MVDTDRLQLRVCSAILTHNRRELEWAVSQPRDIIGDELYEEVLRAWEHAPIPGEHGLVQMTNYFPAWIQYIGQRAVLLFPSVARRLLRSSGLHHQMY